MGNSVSILITTPLITQSAVFSGMPRRRHSTAAPGGHARPSLQPAGGSSGPPILVGRHDAPARAQKVHSTLPERKMLPQRRRRKNVKVL